MEDDDMDDFIEDNESHSIPKRKNIKRIEQFVPVENDPSLKTSYDSFNSFKDDLLIYPLRYNQSSKLDSKKKFEFDTNLFTGYYYDCKSHQDEHGNKCLAQVC